MSSSPVVRSQSFPGSRRPSPILNSSQSKVSSPSQSRPCTPIRGLSTSRIRPSGSSSQSMSSASVLSFISDFRNPKKNNQLEDSHQLRLLYNRHLQWRYANARTDIALRIQKATAERSLNNVWRTNLALWESVIKKRIRLQQVRFELKLNSVQNEQLRYLDDWASFEKEYSLSLTGITKDLEASTLRLPITGGSRADIKSLKVAIGSAMDVMQSMGPSVITLLSRAEGMNTLVSRLADLAVQERAMLDECEALLAMNAIMQVARIYCASGEVLREMKEQYCICSSKLHHIDVAGRREQPSNTRQTTENMSELTILGNSNSCPSKPTTSSVYIRFFLYLLRL